MKTLRAALPLALLALAAPAAAQPQPPDGRRPQPPQEAFAACNGRSAGDACSVSFHGHTIEGRCAAFPETQTLACRPNHMPGPPPRR